ncbi:acyltransferase domain-containing protein [Streptomyces monticola]|uniref:Acyltransferase domain-containing protein n=1 Tax=Streptomyces monticola TaxID=2666263 RepID=A0ABW2JX44_9ACTN
MKGALKEGVAVHFPAWRGRSLPRVRSLYGTSPVFRAEFDTVRHVLDGHLQVPLVAAVFAPSDGVDEALLDVPSYGNAALFAYQTALFGLWQSWGLRPARVAGDGVGAVTAAYVLGRLDLDRAARAATQEGAGAPPPRRQVEAVSGVSQAV